LIESRVKTFTGTPFEAAGLTKGGRVFPIEVAAKQHFYEGREVRLVTVRDVSERLQVERQREKNDRG
jgi:PAS domain S-box-containing protein